MKPAISECKICFSPSLITTDIDLPEGPLRQCQQCEQLFSSCTTEEYQSSLAKWNTINGTLPDLRSERRFEKNVTRRLLKSLKFVATGSQKMKLLDVGCSSGALLHIAQKIGFSVKGVELAPLAAETAKQAGFDVFQGLLNDAHYSAHEFDVIVLFELIEHITDPVDLIQECRRILKPGGVILINTPNANSWTSNFMKGNWAGYSLIKMGGHISFFSPKSIQKLAESSNLQLNYIQTKNVRFYEKGQSKSFIAKAANILSEFLKMPAQILNKGHDLFAVFHLEAPKEKPTAHQA